MYHVYIYPSSFPLSVAIVSSIHQIFLFLFHQMQPSSRK